MVLGRLPVSGQALFAPQLHELRNGRRPVPLIVIVGVRA
jgi:hypothetical protein